MTSPKINKIEIQGFRAFGRNGQTLAFGSLLAAVWAPNSQGKTSLAEAFEFLLTGQIVRRQLMASTQDEFADALRNAHMPAGMSAYVEAEIAGEDGKPHKVRRTLISDYTKRRDCQSTLQIGGRDAKEAILLPSALCFRSRRSPRRSWPSILSAICFRPGRRTAPATLRRSSRSRTWKNSAAAW